MTNWVQLHVVRHGDTAYTEAGRVQGIRDVPLSSGGIAQAEATAEVLRLRVGTPVRIVSSDLQRARRTARILSEGLQAEGVELLEGLRERAMGSDEGKLWSELPADVGSDWEPAVDFRRRVLLAVRRIAERSDAEVVLVTHGGVIGELRAAVNLPTAYTRPGAWLRLEANAVGGLRVPPPGSDG
jgi:probable phosphoglycerate mutase